MGSEDALAAMKDKLAGLDAENSARMALLDRSRESALAESKEKLDKQAKIQGEVIVRLQERNRRAKKAGGWMTEATAGDTVEDDDFGFEEDEAELDRRARYRTEDEPPARFAPPPAPLSPVPPPAPEPSRPAGRHRRTAAQSDDDFADTDWLAT
jgi:hypothetical protein